MSDTLRQIAAGLSCGHDFMVDAIEAALRDAQAQERARCAGVARAFAVDVSATAKDFARAIAEAIEDDAGKAS